MSYRPTIQTAFGPRLIAETPMLTLSLNAHEADLLAGALRREAEAALEDGRVEMFDRLHIRATSIHEAARITRAPHREIRPARHFAEAAFR